MKTEIAYPHYPGYVQQALTQGVTYADIRRVLYDPRVVECLTGLLSEVLKHPITPRQKTYNQEYYETVLSTLNHLGYIRLTLSLASTYITGRSISELLWSDRDGKLLPDKFIPRAEEFLYYKWDNPKEGYYPVMWARGAEFKPNDFPRQFIISHYWAVPNDDPHGNGLGELLYPLTTTRGKALEDWAKYSSTYAEPTRVGHYPDSATDEEIAQFNMFINKLGSARAVTLPEGFTVDYINPPSNAGSSQADLYNTVSQDISLLIMGESTAGRQHVGGTATQDEVSTGLRGSRAYLLGSLISDTISNTISKWIGELNFPGEPPLELVYEDQKPPDTTPGAEGLDSGFNSPANTRESQSPAPE